MRKGVLDDDSHYEHLGYDILSKTTTTELWSTAQDKPQVFSESPVPQDLGGQDLGISPSSAGDQNEAVTRKPE